MSRAAPALVPLFRSEQQLRILVALFADGGGEMPIRELADRAAVAQATASREAARLAEHGIVLTRALGRNTLVRPNWGLSWAKDLRSILVQTVGILGRLGEALEAMAGVDEAYVFGSWAARYTGEPGPPPRDVDVLVVGRVSLRTVRAACRGIEEDLKVEVNPVVMEPERWAARDPEEPFVAQLKEHPLVPIPLERG